MKVWIDLANSPHVLFFAPIVDELKRRGHETFITARNFAQTLDLASLHGLRVIEVGRHGGASALGKAHAIALRALKLRALAREAGVDLAVSHNSYAHSIAAKFLAVPYVTIMDYEHTPANHVSFRLADRILLPSVVGEGSVGWYGANKKKLVFYEGFKEQVYLETLKPDRLDFQSMLPPEIWNGHVVVVARPPADFAIYHRFKNPLFETWLERAGREEAVRILVLPRTEEQRTRILHKDLSSVVVPASAVPGPELLSQADLVVSAGGTMNREAAVLGIPAYSLFAGHIGGVDRSLERLGRLTFVRSESDLGRICLRKKACPEPLLNPGLKKWMVDYIVGTHASQAV